MKFLFASFRVSPMVGGFFDPIRLEAYALWFLALSISLAIVWFYLKRHRREERRNLFGKREAVELGIDRPPAQHPMIDTSLCIGCGSCVKACPEGGVLGLVRGKATIINGLRCVGHGKCAQACPVEAVQIGLGDTSGRDDLPTMNEDFETNIPGVYIIGELGGMALVKNAISQGAKAVEAIAKDFKPGGEGKRRDLVIVGAGPAGMSAALAAKKHGFSHLVLEQEEAGGTILQYPRKKMMLTQPVEIPLFGWLKKPQYLKEELLDIWQKIIEEHRIPIARGEVLDNLEPEPDGFRIVTSKGVHHARRVLLALGRRGSPRKLGAPGEDKPKVMYKMLDACTYNNEHILVVGGGDSAVEAAVALSRQEGNTVTMSYRKSKFFRIKQRNMEQLEKALEEKRLTVIFDSSVVAIEDARVILNTAGGKREIPNDYVFIFAGGVAPFGLLKKIGIGFGGEPAARDSRQEKKSIHAA